MIDRREIERLDFAELYTRGVAAARVGETDEARAYLEAALEKQPDSADAWMWLAGVVEGPRAKRDAFRKVLELRPEDPEATQGIARLAEKYGSGMVLEGEEPETLHCTWHPDRETLLRCTRCGRPMCVECAVRHPVGMRCKACVRELRSPIYVVSPVQLAAGGTVAFALSVMAGGLLSAFSGAVHIFFWFIAFLAGSAAGAGIADLSGRAAGRKRGRTLALVVAVSAVVGTLAGFVLAAVVVRTTSAVAGPQPPPFTVVLGWVLARPLIAIRDPIAAGLYLFAAVGSITARLR
jgi:hypothetical protein